MLEYQQENHRPLNTLNETVTDFGLVPKKAFSKFKKLKKFDETLKNDDNARRQNVSVIICNL